MSSLLVCCIFLAIGFAEATPPNLSPAATIERLRPRANLLTPQESLQLAKAFLAAKREKEALKVLENAVTKFPENLSLKREYGILLIDQNQDRLGILKLKEVLDANKADELAYLGIAKAYERRNNRYELRLLFEDIILNVKNSSQLPAHQAKLCELTMLEGLSDAALQACERAQKDNPKDPMVKFNLAMVHVQKEDKNKSRALFRQIRENHKEHGEAQKKLGLYLLKQKNFMDAYSSLQAAHKAKNNDLEVLKGLAQSAFELQKFKESLEAFRAVCRIEPGGSRELQAALASELGKGKDPFLEKMRELNLNCRP